MLQHHQQSQQQIQANLQLQHHQQQVNEQNNNSEYDYFVHIVNRMCLSPPAASSTTAQQHAKS